MSTIGQIAVFTAAFMQTVSAYSSYLELIPNGEAIHKPLGHSDKGYTEFGTLFSDKGTTWAAVCTETWPGGSVTCGEALGDPCCTWTSAAPDFALTEPNAEGTTCATDSKAASEGITAAPVTSEAETPAIQTDQYPTKVDETTPVDPTIVSDSSEYCE